MILDLDVMIKVLARKREARGFFRNLIYIGVTSRHFTDSLDKFRNTFPTSHRQTSRKAHTIGTMKALTITFFILLTLVFDTSGVSELRIREAQPPGTSSEDAIATDFPVVYVAGGILECQFIPDVCSTVSSVVSVPSLIFSWTTETAMVVTQGIMATASFSPTLNDTYQVIITTTYSTYIVYLATVPLPVTYTETISSSSLTFIWTVEAAFLLTDYIPATATFDVTLNDTIILLTTTYTTQVLYPLTVPLTGHYVQTLPGETTSTTYMTNRITNATRPKLPSIIPTTATMSYSSLARRAKPVSTPSAEQSRSPQPTANEVLEYAKRSYDYDVCDGVPPSHDFVSNSASEVCHFVANAEKFFVTLQPTAAAYMPSWGGFIVQVGVAIWNLLSIVITYLEKYK